MTKERALHVLAMRILQYAGASYLREDPETEVALDRAIQQMREEGIPEP